MQINTRKDGIAQFSLTKREFKILAEAATIIKAIARNVGDERYVRGVLEMDQLLIDLTQPLVMEEAQQ